MFPSYQFEMESIMLTHMKEIPIWEERILMKPYYGGLKNSI